MSIYLSQARLAADRDFTARVLACVQQETSRWEAPPTADPTSIVQQIMPFVAISPGFGEKYLYGVQAEERPPGQDAIGDGEILATVQPMLEAYRPVTEEGATKPAP